MCEKCMHIIIKIILMFCKIWHLKRNGNVINGNQMEHSWTNYMDSYATTKEQ